MSDEQGDAKRFVSDQRRAAFCYQTHDALDALRAWYSENAPTKLTTALGIYLTLTEAANRNGGEDARAGFRAYRLDLAELAGVSVDTFDRYVRDFEKIGLITIERKKIAEKVHLPNTWVLGDPPSRTHAATLAAPVRPNARDQSPEPKKTIMEEHHPVAPPPENRPATVNRRTVTDDEYAKAVAVLDVFNQVAGTGYSSKDFVAKVVMRIREHPDVTVPQHGLVIATAFRKPWWRDEASPSVVYGNAGLFERSLEAARSRNAVAGRTLSPEELNTWGDEWGDGTPYASLAEARWARASESEADVVIEEADVVEVA